MISIDLRECPRVNVRVAIPFRVLDHPEIPEQNAESENMSQHGIHFLTDAPLQIGITMEVTLQIPHDLTQKVSSEVECIGRVAHIRPIDGKVGVLGIGIHIEWFSARMKLQEWWTS